MATHGLRYTKLYKVWAWIKGRTNTNSKSCKNNYKNDIHLATTSKH